MKKKLLFIVFNQFGYFSIYINWATRLSKKYDISFLCFDQGLPKIESTEFRVIYVERFNSKIKRQYTLLKQCRDFLRTNKFDSIIIKYFHFVSVYRFLGLKNQMIVDIRTGDMHSNKFLRSIFNLLILIEASIFHKIVVLSEGLKTRLSLPAKKTIVVPLGASKIELPSKQFENIRLLYIGVLNTRRIYDTLKGLKLFYDKHPSIEINYDIIGYGTNEEEEMIINGIIEFGLQSKVVFHGRIFGHLLNPFFEKCNIGVAYVPLTIGYDVQPVTKLFEYMFAGMPVIATETSENERIITDSNGVLIKDNAESFYKGLDSIYKSRALYNSATIKNSVKDFDWEVIIRKRLIPFLEK
jgi:glycosyltransferase involved in cell wall biosynthesis